MKFISAALIATILISIVLSCKTSGYITDRESIQRQKKMRSYRTGVNFADAGLLFVSTIGAAFTGVNVYAEPTSRSFKMFRLVSASNDTLFVNMVTDWLWKDSAYCDIREIIMPPLQKAKVIVPLGATYNIYFRNDFNAPDDEKVEVNTVKVRKATLIPQKELQQQFQPK